MDKDVIQLSQPPAHKAWTYESMWVYGNLYCVDTETGPVHMTYDFRVACIFKQASHTLIRDQNMVMAYFNYIGVLKDILVMDYSSMWLVLFKCCWILANIQGNATIHQDEHGF